MDSFDQNVKKAKEFLDSAAQKTEEIVAVQKIKFKINSKKNALNKIYAAMGKTWYKECDRKSLNDSTVMLFKEADETLESIKALNSELSALTNEVTCEKCGGKNPKTSQYCARCGEKL